MESDHFIKLASVVPKVSKHYAAIYQNYYHKSHLPLYISTLSYVTFSIKKVS